MPQDTKLNIIIVGAGKAGELILKDIQAHADYPFKAVGFVDDDATKQGNEIEGVKVLGAIDDLAKLNFVQ